MDVKRDSSTMHDFIVGRMSDEERRGFEDRLVHEPQLVRELEQSLRMREGLHQLRRQGYFAKAASRRRRPPLWIPALVAAGGAGLALFLWLPRLTGPASILVPSLGSHAATGITSLVTAHFTFVPVRGASAPDLDLPSAGFIELRAAPTTRQTAHRYHVTLVRQKEDGPAESVGDLTGVDLSTDGYVHCYADASRLAPGRYVLRVHPDTDSPSGAVVFPFNLHARSSAPSR